MMILNYTKKARKFAVGDQAIVITLGMASLSGKNIITKITPKTIYVQLSGYKSSTAFKDGENLMTVEEAQAAAAAFRAGKRVPHPLAPKLFIGQGAI